LAWSMLALLACEPSSATDKERGRQEMREMLAEHARWGENEREMREYKREFALRFQGQVQPGVGCRVCPDMCRNADLRQVPVTQFHSLYREAVRKFSYPGDDRTHQLAWLELKRLACIARDGGPAM